MDTITKSVKGNHLLWKILSIMKWCFSHKHFSCILEIKYCLLGVDKNKYSFSNLSKHLNTRRITEIETRDLKVTNKAIASALRLWNVNKEKNPNIVNNYIITSRSTTQQRLAENTPFTCYDIGQVWVETIRVKIYLPTLLTPGFVSDVHGEIISFQPFDLRVRYKISIQRGGL